MKTITSKTILMLLTGAFLVLLFNSCTKDPVIPEDETKNKLHEDPAKVTVRLVECHLHADWNEIQTNGGPHQNPESPARHIKRIQDMAGHWQKVARRSSMYRKTGNIKIKDALRLLPFI